MVKGYYNKVYTYKFQNYINVNNNSNNKKHMKSKIQLSEFSQCTYLKGIKH